MSQLNVDTIKKVDGTGNLTVPAETGTLVIKDGSNDVTLNDITANSVFLGGTGAANQLADYEEGTWTPVLEGSSVNPTVTYLSQDASYTKIGNLVRVDFAIATTNIASAGSGSLKLAGLPFTTSASVQRSAGSMSYNDMLSQTSAGMNPVINQNQNFLRFNFFSQDSARIQSGIDCSDLDTGASTRYIQGSIIYRI